ncbi:hypothetical protein WJX73_002461 [Symbiochloris irregularis]|uniref:Uncharacterized protein n=1 Tax=Symbiochloris irregularis TaxID=706552 RepID=A0AAW1PRW1_9CHLO
MEKLRKAFGALKPKKKAAAEPGASVGAGIAEPITSPQTERIRQQTFGKLHLWVDPLISDLLQIFPAKPASPPVLGKQHFVTVHGLMSADKQDIGFVENFSSRSGEVHWPSAWLPRDFPRLNIYAGHLALPQLSRAVGLVRGILRKRVDPNANSSLKGQAGTFFAMLEIAFASSLPSGRECEQLALLGHSCGAVVILEALSQMDRAASDPLLTEGPAALLRSCTLAIFVAPPFGGGNFVAVMNRLGISSQLMDELGKQSQGLMDLVAAAPAILARHGISTLTILEGRLWKDLCSIVSCSSGTRLMPKRLIEDSTGDHVTCMRLVDQQGPVYQTIADMLNKSGFPLGTPPGPRHLLGVLAASSPYAVAAHSIDESEPRAAAAPAERPEHVQKIKTQSVLVLVDFEGTAVSVQAPAWERHVLSRTARILSEEGFGSSSMVTYFSESQHAFVCVTSSGAVQVVGTLPEIVLVTDGQSAWVLAPPGFTLTLLEGEELVALSPCEEGRMAVPLESSERLSRPFRFLAKTPDGIWLPPADVFLADHQQATSLLDQEAVSAWIAGEPMAQQLCRAESPSPEFLSAPLLLQLARSPSPMPALHGAIPPRTSSPRKGHEGRSQGIRS